MAFYLERIVEGNDSVFGFVRVKLHFNVMIVTVEGNLTELSSLIVGNCRIA